MNGSPSTGFDTDKTRALLIYLSVESRALTPGRPWQDYFGPMFPMKQPDETCAIHFTNCARLLAKKRAHQACCIQPLRRFSSIEPPVAASILLTSRPW